MQRRDFMKAASITLAGLALPAPSWAKDTSVHEKKAKPASAPWKNVEYSTRVWAQTEAPTMLWLPLPLAQSSYQELSGTDWQGNFSSAGIMKDKVTELRFFTPVGKKRERWI